MSTAGPSVIHIDPAPAPVPSRTLRSGMRIPAIGMGTFGSDCYGPADIAQAVKGCTKTISRVRAADTGLFVATGERRAYANVLLTIGIA
ncbi:hypothetical protein QFZ40_002287 [Arthrobacter pascens]|nr:hypothetical protein [Arthrobacter pascens]